MFLFFLMTFLITYGSLYPFEFVRLGADSDSFIKFYQTWGAYTHQGDILANIVLFVPFGITGVQMLVPKLKNCTAIFIILVAGLMLGVVLQIGQIYIPSRDANLSDAVLNFMGTFLGTLIAASLNINKLSLSDVKSKLNSFPVLLLLSWLAYRLMPFVPSLDLQEIKNSFKPLFLSPKWEFVRIFHDITAWMIAFYLLSRSKQKYYSIRFFVLVILLCFSLEIIIVNNVVSLSNFIGAALAVILWKTFFDKLKDVALWLAVMMVVVLFASGLAPYKLANTTQIFQWLPFYGFLGGSMLVNISSFFEKFYLYGALILLIHASGVRLWLATLVVACVTLCIELGQVFLTSHVAEITDPLLVVLIGFLAFTLRKKGETGFSHVSIHNC